MPTYADRNTYYYDILAYGDKDISATYCLHVSLFYNNSSIDYLIYDFFRVIRERDARVPI